MLHPHAMTYVFNRESIDYFVANTDPKYVTLCIDTASYYPSGY